MVKKIIQYFEISKHDKVKHLRSEEHFHVCMLELPKAHDCVPGDSKPSLLLNAQQPLAGIQSKKCDTLTTMFFHSKNA